MQNTNWIVPNSESACEMSNIFNEDFIDFIQALNNAEVKYVLIGGYAVIIHGYQRTTGDMDIFVECTKENYSQIKKAFHLFQMPLFGMTEDKFLDSEKYDVFEYGKPPISIDIITKIKGITFNDAYATAQLHLIGDHLTVRVIHVNALIQAKKASGRPKDLDDIEHLEEM